jgi:hypothetical protein
MTSIFILAYVAGGLWLTTKGELKNEGEPNKALFVLSVLAWPVVLVYNRYFK